LNYVLSEWLNLAFRWFHVVAGVFWIGQTALFSWLDTRMRIEETEDGQRVWMVHGGGFYRIDKIVDPDTLPKQLHWFKWESAFTWLSGMVLLTLVYYSGGVLVPYEEGMPLRTGILLSLGILVVGWVVYDALWIGPFRGRPGLGTALSLAAVIALEWYLSTVFSGRGAYIQMGALFGTIMAANVWMRILPGQRTMLAAISAGEPIDHTYADVSKQRSTHNTFLALPLIFIMISNHFPVTTFGHRLNWLVLVAIVFVGFGARAAINRHESC
jgi:uncharacterized membrane protein